jgi:hypothetical protein
MKTFKFVLFLAILGMCAAPAVLAQEAATEEVSASTEKSECSGKCAVGEGACSKCEGGCPVAAAMEKLPKMTFVVGTEETCCSASAASLAKKHSLPVKFVVAEKQYDSEGDAMVALADATESYVNELTQPHTCKVSGSTSLAGSEIGCCEKAGKIAAEMKKAMDTIAISYKVGEKECHCPNEAKTLAEKSGEKTEYVVGESATCCSVEARINLAKAKLKAAMEVMHSSMAATAETDEGSES